jgi:hypothetical protein
MWQCLAQAPGDGYWQRVRCLAAAAGYVAGFYDLDPQLEKLVAERVAAGNPEREDSPTYLLKRLKQLEQENATLRQATKRSRPEDAAADLTDLVTELKHSLCAAILERISALIKDASDQGKLGPGPEHRRRQGARSHPSCSPPSRPNTGQTRCSWPAWAAHTARDRRRQHQEL